MLRYPHEKEVLLPPLTGIEPTQTAVDGDILEIHSRLSLNLAAQTLEQARPHVLYAHALGCSVACLYA